jgi:hypothetical protein
MDTGGVDPIEVTAARTRDGDTLTYDGKESLMGRNGR